jgi:hypothetical protein
MRCATMACDFAGKNLAHAYLRVNLPRSVGLTEIASSEQADDTKAHHQ